MKNIFLYYLFKHIFNLQRQNVFSLHKSTELKNNVKKKPFKQTSNITNPHHKHKI